MLQLRKWLAQNSKFKANVTIGGLLARSSGQVINQNLEMVFGGVTIRSFNFVDLVPKVEEAYVVKSIIKSLKIHSAAKLDNDGMFLNALIYSE